MGLPRLGPVAILREDDALEETYRELETVIRGLVERYAIPHTKMCMRWSKPPREAYRQEVAAWLEDYGKSFRRLPRKSLGGREDLPAFARRRLEGEIAAVLAGDNAAVERSYGVLFG